MLESGQLYHIYACIEAYKYQTSLHDSFQPNLATYSTLHQRSTNYTSDLYI